MRKTHSLLSGNRMVLYLNKLDPLHIRILCAKFKWNWPSRSGEEEYFKSLSMCYHYFEIIAPSKRAEVFIWINLNSIHPRMHCAKFGWNWPSSSGEENFWISSMYYRYSRNYLPLKRGGALHLKNLNIHLQGCFVPSFVEIDWANGFREDF